MGHHADELAGEETIVRAYPGNDSLTAVDDAEVRRPGYLKSYIDPVYDTRVTRITDSRAFGYKDPRHNYSKCQPWNCDGSLIRIRDRILDGKTYAILGRIPWLNESKWSHTEPSVIYGIDDQGGFTKISLRHRRTRVLKKFRGYDEVRMGPWEGNLSADDSSVVICARRGRDLTVMYYDLERNRILATEKFPGMWKKLDWVSVSPSGKFVVFNWSPDGDTSKIDCYSRELEFIRRLAQQGGHGDLGYDAEGIEWYVQFEYGDQRGVWAYRIDTGERRRLLPDKYNGGHISCRNVRRPGWCYLSCKANGYREVFSLKMDGSGVVNRFAQHHSSSSSYEAEVKAVPDPDGTKVMFTSDWNGRHEISSFVAEVIQESND